jgi:hypothetical protein
MVSPASPAQTSASVQIVRTIDLRRPPPTRIRPALHQKWSIANFELRILLGKPVLIEPVSHRFLLTGDFTGSINVQTNGAVKWADSPGLSDDGRLKPLFVQVERAESDFSAPYQRNLSTKQTRPHGRYTAWPWARLSPEALQRFCLGA